MDCGNLDNVRLDVGYIIVVIVCIQYLECLFLAGTGS